MTPARSMGRSSQPRARVQSGHPALLTRSAALLWLGWFAVSGCDHRGPHTVIPDRFDYANAIGDSAKTQSLLNIVRLRYLDAPVFLEVQQVVAGYNWEHSGSLGFSAGSGPSYSGDVGYSGTYTERPTISYAPVGGRDFVESILTPVSVNAVLFLVQSELPIHHLLGIMVQSINGKFNTPDGVATSGEEFLRTALTLRKLQELNALSIHIGKTPDDPTTLGFRPWLLEADMRTELDAMKQTLDMDPGRDNYTVIFDSIEPDPGTLAIETRSILKIMMSMAAYVEVPTEDEEAGRALPSPSSLTSDVSRAKQLFSLRIRSSEDEPDYHVYAKTAFHRRWFWVEDDDTASKRIFSYLAVLFSVAQGTAGSGGPNLVITTN